MNRRRFLGASLLATAGSGTLSALVRAGADSRPLVHPERFGATGGSDDTAAIRRMAVEAAAAGLAIDGRGRTYRVHDVSWPSGTRLSRIRLTLIGGSGDDRSPVSVDGRAGGVADLRFEDVHVDGNRREQVGVGASGYADGARSGFQLRGHVERVALINCSATNCATDGVMIFSDRRQRGDADPILRDIAVTGFVGRGNRRHGLSADCFRNLRIIGGALVGNGRDGPGARGDAHGLSGARHEGRLYGRPFDIEDYGVGTGWSDLLMDGVDHRGNATGALIYSQASPDEAGFTPRSRLTIRRCRFDDPGRGRWDAPLTIAQLGSYKGPRATFADVLLAGNAFDDGPVLVSGVDGLVVDGLRMQAMKRPGDPVVTVNCRRVTVRA